jgi:predicted esterase
MRRLVLLAGLAAAMCASGGGPAAAAETPEKAPGPRSSGKVYAWKTKKGLRYEYFVPEKYDPAKGANLTFIFHGTGLDRRWGFANHQGGDFRPEDVVVSPDGPTPNGQSRLFLGKSDDVAQVHDLQEELKGVFKVRQVFVYGHSQGAFFAFLYAGAFQEEVAGALGQAGGIWNGTTLSRGGHGQAMVVMHGTADPVVPFGNAVGSMGALREAEYPMAHLRAMEGWNHWPTPFHAAQELAWMEGMTTTDPDRAAASLDHFDGITEKEWIDFGGLHALGKRIGTMAGAPEPLRARGTAAAAAVEKLAEEHAAAIRAGAGKDPGAKFDGKPWIGHAVRLLRDFEGVPARDALDKDWNKLLERHRDKGVEGLRDYYRARGKDNAKAFEGGVRAVCDGWLYVECADMEFLNTLEAWEKDARKLKLDAGALKAYRQVVAAYRDALKKGWDDYAGINRKF